MSLEIEKKYRLTSEQTEQITSRLKRIGAEFDGEEFEENIIYTGGVLSGRNAVLRLRKIGGAKTLLTYKERLDDDAEIKHQTEYETGVEDFAQIEKILGQLGFERHLIYEKRRRKWRFQKTEIVLDELPFGLFMEIEGSVEAIENAEKLLAAGDLPAEHLTYPALTASHGREINRMIEARFENIR